MSALQRMHAAILAEVRGEIHRLETALAELRHVEQYHAQRCERATASEVAPVATPSASRLVKQEFRLCRDMSKHDAIRTALRALGGRAKTVEIAKWLKDHGHVGPERRAVYYNGIFTALKRGCSEFRKVEGEAGLWELVTPEEDAVSSAE